MNTETTKVLLFLGLGLAVAVILHLVISRLRYWIEARLRQAGDGEGTEARPVFDPLLADWIVRGLRMIVWIVFFIFAANLMPQARLQFGSATERLLHVRDQLLGWLFNRGLFAVIIAAVTIFLARFVGAVIKTAFDLLERRSAHRGDTAAQRRLQTLSSIFRRTAQVVVIFIGLLEVLYQLNLNITPILASAGVVGIAVGFGAQSLIKDLFAGLLILLEDQFRVGDVVKIGETSGTVEQLTLRATSVRSIDGALTTVPNGAITVVANLSRDWSRAVIDIEVDYQENLDRAMKLMLETTRQMRAEQPRELIDEPVMLGVERLTNTSALLRMLVKTAPARHMDVGRELRRRIKVAFEDAGIRTPPTFRFSEGLKNLPMDKAKDTAKDAAKDAAKDTAKEAAKDTGSRSVN